jgi:TPR repeat protein
MYPDIDWDSEPNLNALREAHSLLKTNADVARQRLEQLADSGSIASMWYLGDAYATGRFFPKELDKARTWFRRAEEAGWTPASFMLGRTYYELKDYKSAFESFSRSAAKDYVPGVYRLAMMYGDGLGVNKNQLECRRLLEIAVSRGHLFAKRDLASLYTSGAFGWGSVLRGVSISFSLLIEMIKITIRGGWKAEGFEDRILA